MAAMSAPGVRLITAASDGDKRGVKRWLDQGVNVDSRDWDNLTPLIAASSQGYLVRGESMYVCMYGHACSKSMDRPGKVVNPARGQLNREMNISLSAFAPENLAWSRETGSAVPSRVSLLISILRLNLVLTYGIPSEFRGFRGCVHLFILNCHTPSGQSRVYWVTQLCTDGSPLAQDQ